MSRPESPGGVEIQNPLLAREAVDKASDRFFQTSVGEIDLDQLESDIRADTLEKARVPVNVRLAIDLHQNLKLLALRRGKSVTAITAELVVLGYKVFIRKELREAALKDAADRGLTREDVTPPVIVDHNTGKPLTADDIPDRPAQAIDEEIAPGGAPSATALPQPQPPDPGAGRFDGSPPKPVGKVQQARPPRIAPRSEHADNANFNFDAEYDDP